MDSNKQLKGKRKSMQRENGDGCHSSKHMSNDKDDTSYDHVVIVDHFGGIPSKIYKHLAYNPLTLMGLNNY
ncbi:UNVERIFIED_CONTAM: hypothetical protein NCL1_27003 [Trichonephila clavipes]